MAAITKNRIVSILQNILTDFQISDETQSTDFNILSDLIDKVRAQMIVADYDENGIVRQEWLSDLGIVEFHRVNFPDDPNVTYCDCDISKAFVPKVISFTGEGGNPDIGFKAIMSVCGKWKYYPKAIELWKDIPAEHPFSLFKFYSRIDTAMYVNKQVEGLRIIAVLETPEDGYIINSEPVTSGNLVAGTEYIVKYKQITYNFITIPINGTFIAQAGLTTYAGTGTVYVADQLVQLSRNQPYPVSMNMARQIILELLTKEFRIAAGEIPDVLNDSENDETKAKQPVANP